MRRAHTTQFGSLASYKLGTDPYDSTKLGLGTLMVQKTGAGNTDKFVGPMPIAAYHYGSDFSGSYGWNHMEVLSWSPEIDWVFGADGSSAAATRRIFLATFNRTTQAWSMRGQIILTYPPATNHTIRGLAIEYTTHTTGTVAVSGTAVTGTSTTWVTDRLCAGNRIGFGTTDPKQVTTWYEINAIGSDTSITLGSNAGTITAGTSYVIEDLSIVTATTNATATNGGVFLAKGINFDTFTTGGNTIPAATTSDNVRAVYWLKSAATETLTVSNGCSFEPITNKQTHYLWAGTGTTTQKLYKFNTRATLAALASGASTEAIVLETAVSGTLTGTAGQSNNGHVAAPTTGLGAGYNSYWFTTTTRCYRTKQLSTITANDSTFISAGDTILIQGLFGSSTYTPSQANLINMKYAPEWDKWMVWNSTTGQQQTVVCAMTNATIWPERYLGADYVHVTGGAAAAGLGFSLPEAAVAAYPVVSNHMLYWVYSTAVTTAAIWAVPYGADWSLGSRVVLPKMQLVDADRVISAAVQATQYYGLDSTNYRMLVEPYRISYRTSGIDDNSGSWTVLDQSNTIQATVTAGAWIQLSLEFLVGGNTCTPAKIHALTLVYDDNNTESNYQFSVTESNPAVKQFAWRHAVAFGSTVPALRVRLYDAITDSLLVDDNTDTPTGTWERSTDGTTYSAWTTADKSNNTTYIRYTPASIADNVQVRAHLTLA